MNRRLFLVLIALVFSILSGFAQDSQKSDLQQRAEAAAKESTVATARFLYIRAFEDYANKGQLKQSVECGTKAAQLYYRENLYKEAFDLLRRIDMTVLAKQSSEVTRSGLNYQTTRERLQMYIKMRKADGAQNQLTLMEQQANLSGDDAVKNDLLYQKTVYYYTFGQSDKGNATFKEMAQKLTAQKEYDKVDEVYQTLIANGRRSNSASLVAQSYKSYIAWKDSVSALKAADELNALKQRIADQEASINEKDGSLSSRMAIIIALCVLAAALAGALAVGAVVLMRFIVLNRRQKKTIDMVNENNALKARFISNISAQLEPSLRKLDGRNPEVQALLGFAGHIQTLSQLECAAGEEVAMEDTQVPQFCEQLMAEIRPKVKADVNLTVNAPKMSVSINREYVAHILRHLLENAAEYTPEGGHISLDFKKRGAHTHQFLVSDTGEGIAVERRDDVFKPFLEVRDLSAGDGLGLPICKQMAANMGGDLSIDPEFSKGTRFVLELHG